MDTELVASYLYQGGASGLSQEETLKTLAVEYAIQSGDLPLPWSQEECEADLPTGPLEIQHTRKLMVTHPEFTRTAADWAYGKFPDVFAGLWEYLHG